MSDELIKELRHRIDALEKRNSDLSAESAKRRSIAGKAKGDLDELRKQVDELTQDRDGWKTKAETTAAERDTFKTKIETTPSEHAAKVKELEGQIRTRDHRDAWKEAIGGELADKASVDDLWGKIKYEPGDELPTPDAIQEQVKAARDAAPYLFKPATETEREVPGGTTQGTAKTPLKVSVDASRGARDNAAGSVRYSKKELREPGWEKRNPSLADAFKAGTAICTDPE